MQVVSTLPPVTGEKYAALTTLLCASSASCAGCAVPGLRPANHSRGEGLCAGCAPSSLAAQGATPPACALRSNLASHRCTEVRQRRSARRSVHFPNP